MSVEIIFLIFSFKMANNNSIKDKTIISWNAGGLKNKKQLLEILIDEQNPVCVAIQESKLLEKFPFKINKYKFLHRSMPVGENENAHGGVGILIHQDLVYRQIHLNTIFQAVAIQTHLHKQVTLCNIYIHPKQDFNESDLEDIISQLPAPFILTGDFNSHNTLWYDSKTDSRGRKIENFVLNNDLIILDKNEFTFFRGKSRTHIDLTIISPELNLDLDWHTHDDPCGSDHIPVIIKINKLIEADERVKWNFAKANWEKFRELAVFNRPIHDFTSIQELSDYITESISKAANGSVGKTVILSGKISKPWWNEGCKIAIQSKKKAYRKFKTVSSIENEIAYRRANAVAIRVVRESKQKSWNKFLESINKNVPTRKVWNKINAIKGNKRTYQFSSIIKNNKIIDKKEDIANAIAENYKDISSRAINRPGFRQFRVDRDENVDFNSPRIKDYNTPITLKELKSALRSAGHTAPGFDEIPYVMIKNLSEDSLNFLLNFYNILFRKHVFPEKWKEALVIPILKPGKDPLECGSYRPIALISCLSKILEKILNKRLMWFLEKHGLLDKAQCGNRRGRTTIDHLTTLTTDIQEALVNREYHVSIFLDLEKAYDTCWKQLILRQLQKFNMSGHLPFYIQNFLSNRRLRVKVGNHFSDQYSLDLGVPQGSSLSVTLFLIAINTVSEFVGSHIQKSLFVDDMRISYASKDLLKIKSRLQHTLTELSRWSEFSGFQFSESKCEVLICSRKTGLDPSIQLKLNDFILPIVKEKKFLGVILDSKLTWKPHILQLKDKCNRSLNLLKTIARSKCRTDTKMLLRIHKATILSKLEYGCQAYCTAAPTTLKLLDPIHHQALRICLGAFRTSPVESLYVESNVASLQDRRTEIGLKYLARTLSIRTNDTVCRLWDYSKELAFANSKRIQNTLGLKLKQELRELRIRLPPIIIQKVSKTPPWIIPQINVCFSLAQLPKKSNSAIEWRHKFAEHKHCSNIDIYTDGSKTKTGVGAGVAIETNSTGNNRLFIPCKIKLNCKSSILSAELKAIDVGLGALNNFENTSCTIYSDSKGALQTLLQYDPIHPLAQDIQLKILKASNKNIEITLCWVPSHCGILGNEQADKTAKEACNIKENLIKSIFAKDLYACINEKVKNRWQSRWDVQDMNKLRLVDERIGDRDFSHFNSRQDEIKFTRLRLGHSRLTHNFILRNENITECEFCNIRLTIKHILLHCPLYSQLRNRIFGDNKDSMRVLLDRRKHKLNLKVILFLKEINLYSEI